VFHTCVRTPCTHVLTPRRRSIVAIKQESIATKRALDNVAKHVSMALYMRISVELTVVTIVYVYLQKGHEAQAKLPIIRFINPSVTALDRISVLGIHSFNHSPISTTLVIVSPGIK
jgi:hypothetical protein